MLLPKDVLEEFLSFIKKMFNIEVHKSGGKEYYRFMLNNSLFVIRDLVEGGEAVEVFCTDKSFGKEVEKLWLSQLYREYRNDTAASAEEDSGVD